MMALFVIGLGGEIVLTHKGPVKTGIVIKPALFGCGAGRNAALHEELGVKHTLAPEIVRYQNAFGVALAAQDKTPTGAEDLLPVYLRLSQAERERQERLQQE